MRAAFVVLAVAASVEAMLAPACRCAQSGSAVGRVVALEPVTELSVNEESWHGAARDDQLHVGDALRTGERGTATLEIVGQGQLKVSPRSLVRFMALTQARQGQEAELHLLVQNGSLDVASSEGSGSPVVVLQGPAGRLKLRRGSRLRLSVDDGEQRMRVEVVVGAAELERDGESAAIATGADLVVTVGVAELVPYGAQEPRREADAGTDAAATAGDADQLEAGIVVDGAVELPVLDERDVQPILRSGSEVVHDPQPNGGFTVLFPAIEGCSRYRVEVRRGGDVVLDAISTRPGFSLADVPYGEYRWRAACDGIGEMPATSEHEGRIARRADRSGQAQVPTAPLHNTLDSTGRQYTVLYQNHLPAITLRWSGAPEAERYRLDVYDNASGRRLHSGQHERASQGFPPGFFREGSYYWVFRVEDASGRRASPLTRVQLVFDNQMPSIQIIEPREGAAATGTVRVRGVAAAGSTVTVNGVHVALSGDSRFDQDVPIGPGNVLVFRVSAPRRGSGLYLRHLSR
jgi:hypothetical protein